MPFSRAISARRATSGSARTSAPPSPHVTFLVSWKLRQPGVAERAEGATAPGGGEALRRVLDHEQGAPAGEVEEGLHVGRDARVVDGQDRGRPWRDPSLDVRGVEAEGRLLDLGEHRASAHAQHGVGARHEGERRADDLLPGSDAQGEQGELEGVGARGREEHPAGAHPLGEERLDAPADGTVARDSPPERLADRLELALVEPRRVKGDRGGGGRAHQRCTLAPKARRRARPCVDPELGRPGSHPCDAPERRARAEPTRGQRAPRRRAGRGG